MEALPVSGYSMPVILMYLTICTIVWLNVCKSDLNEIDFAKLILVKFNAEVK